MPLPCVPTTLGQAAAGFPAGLTVLGSLCCSGPSSSKSSPSASSLRSNRDRNPATSQPARLGGRQARMSMSSAAGAAGGSRHHTLSGQRCARGAAPVWATAPCQGLSACSALRYNATEARPGPQRAGATATPPRFIRAPPNPNVSLTACAPHLTQLPQPPRSSLTRLCRPPPVAAARAGKGALHVRRAQRLHQLKDGAACDFLHLSEQRLQNWAHTLPE